MTYEIAMVKIILATVAFVIASGAAYAMAAVMGKTKCPKFCGPPVSVHRWLGRTAILFVLLTAFVCIFYAPSSAPTIKTRLHSVLGVVTIALIALKILVARGVVGSREHLPTIGRFLYLSILLIWIGNALTYFLGY